MATQPPPGKFTFWEYLHQERAADFKSEFYDGQIYAMSGGSEPHSRLAARIIGLLGLYLPRCRVYDSNLKLFIERFAKGVYPDAMVICGEPQFWEGQKDVIVNPSLVVEVLSPSTEKYDHGDKSSYYRSIRSLQAILIVSQDQVFAECSTNEGDQVWKVTQHVERHDRLRVLDMQIRVGEIYDGVL